MDWRLFDDSSTRRRICQYARRRRLASLARSVDKFETLIFLLLAITCANWLNCRIVHHVSLKRDITTVQTTNNLAPIPRLAKDVQSSPAPCQCKITKRTQSRIRTLTDRAGLREIEPSRAIVKMWRRD